MADSGKVPVSGECNLGEIRRRLRERARRARLSAGCFLIVLIVVLLTAVGGLWYYFFLPIHGQFIASIGAGPDPAEFSKFLADCLEGMRVTAEGAGYSKVVETCFGAWSDGRGAVGRWWEMLVALASATIIVLYGMAVLTLQYRYNLRLARFYQARGDVLDALGYSDGDALISAEKPGEALKLATEFLAADAVGMGKTSVTVGDSGISIEGFRNP